MATMLTKRIPRTDMLGRRIVASNLRFYRMLQHKNGEPVKRLWCYRYAAVHLYEIADRCAKVGEASYTRFSGLADVLVEEYFIQSRQIPH